MLVEKCNQNNAIKVAAFAIEFLENCSSEMFKSFNEYVAASKSELFTDSKLLEGFSFQINADDPAESVSKNQQIHGVLLTNNDGWALSFKDSVLVLQCTEYKSWDDAISFTALVWEFFVGFLNESSDELPVQALGLEYLDEFFIKNKDSDWCSALFNKNSVYLPAHIFSQVGFWHAHTGFYDQDILNRMRLDYVQDSEGRYIQSISMQHRFTCPGEGYVLKAGAPLNNILEAMSAMHTSNVKLIKDLLTPEMLKDINMEVDCVK